MSNRKPRLLHAGLALWVGLAMAATLSSGLHPMGLEATNSAQSWWTARRFQQADADHNLLGMRDLGAKYLHQTGDGTPLDFAIYSVGFAASGPSMNRLPADALDWALVGAATAETHLQQLPFPWTTLQTQSHTLVERAFPVSNDPAHLAAGLRAMEMWLASGGGHNQLSKLTSSAYRSYIGTAVQDRPAFLLQRLAGESSAESAD